MSADFPESLGELFPQITSMSDSEKLLKLARHMPCDQCDCQGWRPNFSMEFSYDCLCGHDTDQHVDRKQDFVRRLKVAFRIDEVLEEKGKIDDYDYTDDDIQSLKKQILYNATQKDSEFLFEASSPSTIDGEELSKRRRESSEEEDEEVSKRFKTFENDSDEEIEAPLNQDGDDDDEIFEEEDEEEEVEEPSDEEEEEDQFDFDDNVEDEDEEDEEDEEDQFQDTQEELKLPKLQENSTASEMVTKDHIEKRTITMDSDKPPGQATDITEPFFNGKPVDLNQKPSNDINSAPRPQHEEEADDGDDDEDIDEEEYETALATKAERALLNQDIPRIKSVTDEGERLLNEEALKVNGVLDAKDGILDSEGKVKVLSDLNNVAKKESPAMIEERTGIIQVRVVENDGARESMILLTGLKNIFQKQLPKMPKEYIARLVYDRNHRSMALIRKPMKVIGGICYRPFDSQEFAEIVFCAIASTEQVKGYGSFLMNHLKDYVSSNTNMKHYLTYADNYATGYFKKQGFTTEITLDKRKWVGYIKDYEGGTIMQCTTVPKVKYLHVHDTLAIQKKAVYEKMKESNRPRHPPHYNQMRHLVTELRANAYSWPFHEAVNAEEVTDYYDVITEPMDLTTLDENVETDVYHTMEEFIRDVYKIFDNCRAYNAEATNYTRCANRLERYFKERLRVWTNNVDEDTDHEEEEEEEGEEDEDMREEEN
ncbi:hypothetical protein [Parasitella parasitica]|uniref:histone acetyltransferase n=1 Tax=Parasitella parasitica TaxID=35722 RepID=A0A0B7MW12_9FUNG|nr:hypothetical protein [Parasitella parasitica]